MPEQKIKIELTYYEWRRFLQWAVCGCGLEHYEKVKALTEEVRISHQKQCDEERRMVELWNIRRERWEHEYSGLRTFTEPPPDA